MSPSITYLKPKDSYKMMKSILIITTCLFGLINNSYAQRIKAELEPSDFSDINAITPFTYTVRLENTSQDTLFYDNIVLKLSFFDYIKNEWVEADILEDRYYNYYIAPGVYTFYPPRAKKMIVPNNKITTSSINVLCKISDLAFKNYTPIHIKNKTIIKTTVVFTDREGRIINTATTQTKINIKPVNTADKACITWLKQQKNPYYLFTREIWGINDPMQWRACLNGVKSKDDLLKIDDYIIEHFPASSFAPWAKLHRVSFIASYKREAIHDFIDQNIKTMEEIVAMPLSNVSQYEILFRALFSRIHELFNLNRDVSAKSMEDEEGMMKDSEIDTIIEEINKKLGAKFNELKYKPK